ncbi:urea ABC transporter ATP-binding protein UrtD [Sporomusa acidovorans]|uniref:Cobalt import ATP-binding protein CbiO n=1 Tax=Sporomusa acidovorans (strain ATCC 49682 / DSM 3132 / Mol) TaxID=1123286 RepID=A0ABZ3JAJ4_SPOA4|nr:urea ABC transporter ATP-binding protein UrtD [Sporomusa acidovorans]OZC16236.1 cobalt import ATP-binding protein CbiO [Sporomusa acidovorans DSM 3132]SDE32293.1 urea transport system ATP-binding protein [Sporomusa acidovorans]
MENVLEIQDLTVAFDGFKAVDNVNTSVEKGEIHFFIGPNGAGKTTLLDAICGRVKPKSGNILFAGGVDVTHYSENQIVNIGIGRKFQVPSVFTGLTVYDNMELAAVKDRSLSSSLFHNVTSEQEELIGHVLNTIGLYEKKDRDAGSLAHGEKQWLEIGMLMAQQPKLMLLDEPVAGMGRVETQKTGELLKTIAKNCTIIVVEHDMEFVRDYASKVTVLHEGMVLDEGSMSEVQHNQKVIEVYLGRGGEQDA